MAKAHVQQEGKGYGSEVRERMSYNARIQNMVKNEYPMLNSKLHIPVCLYHLY